MSNAKPVIFLAFANDRVDNVRYLRNLSEEARRLRATLEAAERNGLCRFILYQGATIDEILDVFQRAENRNRIAIFHFGGHADGYKLLVENAEGAPAAAHAGGLAAFLGHQQGLELVFLNGCSTQRQAQGLLDAGVATVVATAQAIDDAIATAFADRFYNGLAGGLSIAQAFAETTATIQTKHGDNSRGCYLVDYRNNLLDDRWPWELTSRAGAETAGDWNLPAAVNDPLFGLPPLPKLDLPETPYRHLEWFRKEDAEIFFGRGREIAELYRRITDPAGDPITLFHGQSGVGKSSVLAAGLLPRLEQIQYVLYERRDHEKGLVVTLADLLQATINTNLNQAWRALEDKAGKPLTVILDQVEEIFTRPNANLPDEMAHLLDALTTIFAKRDQRPQGRLILSFRKEWLAEIEKRLQERGLPRSTVFLERLNRNGIIEAISGPARESRLYDRYGLNVAEDLPGLIADDLLADPGSPVAPMLQILLTDLWKLAKKKNDNHPRFDSTLYNALLREDLPPSERLGLDYFLERQIGVLRVKQQQAVESGLALDFLAYHTTPLGTAEQHRLAEVEQTYRDQASLLPALMQECRDLYLLVNPSDNQPDQHPASRLTHDTLAPHVRKRFERSDLPGQRARRILESRFPLSDSMAGHQIEMKFAPLGDVDLDVVVAGKAGMRTWSNQEQALVTASLEDRQRRREERETIEREREEARQRELEQAHALAVEQRKRAEESEAAAESQRKSSSQLRRLVLGLVSVLVIALSATWLAMHQSQVATARNLVTQSRLQINSQDLNLATLLALEAQRYEPEEVEYILGAEIPGNLDPLVTASTLLGQHSSGVRSVAWSPDGQTLASGSHDNTIKLWNVANRELVRILQGHNDWIWSISWSPDGRMLASGSYDGTIKLWDATSGENMRTLHGHEDWISGVSWSPDGRTLASGSLDGTIKLWNVANGELLQTIHNGGDVYDVSWSPDGGVLASGLADYTIKLWNVKNGNNIRTFVGHWDDVRSVSWSPDGRALASGSDDGTIKLWDAGSGENIQTLHGHEDWISSVAWNPDGRTLASGSADNTIKLWDAVSGDNIQTIHGHGDWIYSVSWSLNGHTLASGSEDHIIKLWDISREKNRNIQIMTGHRASINSVAWSPNGSILASGADDRTIKLWNPTIGELLHTWSNADEVSSITWNSDGSMLASQDGITIKIWNVANAEIVKSFEGFVAGFSNIAWSPDDLTMASGSISGSVKLWNVEIEESQTFYGGVKLFTASEASLHTLEGHDESVTGVAWSPDGRTLASGSYDNTIKLWDVTQSKLLRTLQGHEDLVLSIAWNPDGRVLASGSRDSTIKLWDTASGKHIRTIQGHENSVTSVAWNPDGDALASASYDGTIKVWDVTRGELIQSLQGPVGRIIVAWSPDGRTLASGSDEGIVRLWPEWVIYHPCTHIYANLTPTQWIQYMGWVIYHPTCPALGAEPVPSVVESLVHNPELLLITWLGRFTVIGASLIGIILIGLLLWGAYHLLQTWRRIVATGIVTALLLGILIYIANELYFILVLAAIVAGLTLTLLLWGSYRLGNRLWHMNVRSSMAA